MSPDDNNTETAASVSTDKAVQLFTYLRELCALRTSQVRDVSQYDEVFWFGDIPRERLCQCIAWRIGQNSDDPGEERSDLWVEVHKPELKRHPEVPEALRQREGVRVISAVRGDGIPELLEEAYRLVVEARGRDADSSEDECVEKST